jgi:hypothetical protein
VLLEAEKTWDAEIPPIVTALTEAADPACPAVPISRCRSAEAVPKFSEEKE